VLCRDCLFFGGLVLYIFLCCVSGIVGLGVRFFVIKLYSIQKGKTMPNAFLMAAWMLQVREGRSDRHSDGGKEGGWSGMDAYASLRTPTDVVYFLTLCSLCCPSASRSPPPPPPPPPAQLMALTLNMEIITIAPTYATFGTQFYVNATSQERMLCDTHLIDAVEHTCVQTQVSRFINTMAVETPFFSVILFYGNLAFLGFFVLFLVHGVFCADNSKKEEVDAFRKLDDESDSD